MNRQAQWQVGMKGSKCGFSLTSSVKIVLLRRSLVMTVVVIHIGTCSQFLLSAKL